MSNWKTLEKEIENVFEDKFQYNKSIKYYVAKKYFFDIAELAYHQGEKDGFAIGFKEGLSNQRFEHDTMMLISKAEEEYKLKKGQIFRDIYLDKFIIGEEVCRGESDWYIKRQVVEREYLTQENLVKNRSGMKKYIRSAKNNDDPDPSS